MLLYTVIMRKVFEIRVTWHLIRKLHYVKRADEASHNITQYLTPRGECRQHVRVRRGSVLRSKVMSDLVVLFISWILLFALLIPVITGVHTISTTVSCCLITTNMDNILDNSKPGFQKRKLPTQEDAHFGLVFRKCLLRISDGTPIILHQVFLVFPSPPRQMPRKYLKSGHDHFLAHFPIHYSLSSIAFGAT
jgi:hypothetical protein